MSFERFVEVGRLVIGTYGPILGKLAIITEIIDRNRCLIDGWTGRQIINLKRIALTKILIKIIPGISSNKIKNLLIKNNFVIKKLYKRKWMQKKLVSNKKRNFNSFEKFKFMIGKKQKFLLSSN